MRVLLETKKLFNKRWLKPGQNPECLRIQDETVDGTCVDLMKCGRMATEATGLDLTKQTTWADCVHETENR